VTVEEETQKGPRKKNRSHYEVVML